MEGVYECELLTGVEEIEVVHAYRLTDSDFVSESDRNIIHTITLTDQEPEQAIITYSNTTMIYLNGYVTTLINGQIIFGPCVGSHILILLLYPVLDLAQIFSHRGLTEALAFKSSLSFVNNTCGEDLSCKGDITNYFNPGLTFDKLVQLPILRFII